MRGAMSAAALSPLLVLVAACGSSSPAAEWSTGKDILDGLKAAGFTCEWTGFGEQVVMTNPLSDEESEYPAVRCDGYGVALIESTSALLESIANQSDCVTPSQEERDSEEAAMPLVVGERFVVVPNGTFPGEAQPADFVKAFGGEATTLIALFDEACPDAAAETSDPTPSGSETTSSDAASSTAAAPTAQSVPTGGLVTVDGGQVPGLTRGSSGPTLVLWADPQAPAVAALDAAGGLGLLDLADSGALTLVLRPATFLDRVNANSDPAVAESSLRAVAALGCAADQGRGFEYWRALLANHPEVEGDGWTDEQLAAVGGDAGLNTAALTTCIVSGQYRDWAASAGPAFEAAGIVGVPYAELDGIEVPTEILVDPAALARLVEPGS